LGSRLPSWFFGVLLLKEDRGEKKERKEKKGSNKKRKKQIEKKR